ncbi:MAG: ankyrin repeat domain-containing protein, partial [Alphaproteobacteria bacterium]|nr:ankyrin repeat domain-containing protein [Alphaproteobacteria bacterium]
MDYAVFAKFKSVFKDCDSLTVQSAILEEVRKYIEKHIGKDQYPYSRDRYHCFYENIEKQTGQIRKKNINTVNKTAKELEKDYYDNMNGRFREGKHETDFAFAIYYWFHAFVEDEIYANEIDSKILEVYSKSELGLELEQELQSVKTLIKQKNIDELVKTGRHSELQDGNKQTFKKIEDEEHGKSLDQIGRSKILDYTTTSDWLSPYNSFAIPFTGRQKEIESLNRFAKDKAAFKLWAIIGPSGAGKTRLAVHWTNKSEDIASWDKIILETHNSNHMNPEYWSEWIPDKSIVLVIDYMFNFSEIIPAIVNRCYEFPPQGGLPHKVRLLILNHILPENYKDWIHDLGTGFNGRSGSQFSQLSPIFFGNNPLNLSEIDSKDQNKIIHNIITELAGSEVQSGAVEKAKKYLHSMNEAWHPLFAALVGHALKENQDYHQWSRIDLIHHYLTGNERAVWQKEGEEGQWAACWIAVATARHGVPFKLLKQYLPENVSYRSVKNICDRIVSVYGDKELPAFQPPILGEIFFLLFLENLPEFENRHIAKKFHEMLSAGDPELQISSALSFVDFIDKLVRNLCIEKPKNNQEEEKINKFWEVLLDFLQSEKFPEDSYMRWAISIALTNMLAPVKEYRSKEEIKRILEQIDCDVLQIDCDALCAVKEHDLLEKSLIAAMTYFEYSQKFLDKTPETLLHLVQNYNRMEKNINGTTALMLASLNGYETVVQFLIEKCNAKVNKTNIIGITALMLASENGHKTVVQTLIKKGKAKVDKIDNEGLTALMLASYNGHEAVVRFLIKKC